MEKSNNLSRKLKEMQAEKGKSQAEFSRELGIAQSTIQSIMKEGNTTLDTLIRISIATESSLDELVFGDSARKATREFLSVLNCYNDLPEGKQGEVQLHVNALLELFNNEQ